jgi:hypothetical protein
MTKSPESAMPCPNKFMAIAIPNAGRPTRSATGTRTAPINATAGDGQKNQEMIIIKIPIVQYASAGVFISLVNGEIMTSFIPVEVRLRLIATIMEITRMVDNNSLMAYIKLLKTLVTEWVRDPVAVRAIRKIPAMHSIDVSRLKIMKRMIKPMKTT